MVRAVEMGQTTQTVAIFVDHHDRVPLVGEVHGQFGADSAATDHDDVHQLIK